MFIYFKLNFPVCYFCFLIKCLFVLHNFHHLSLKSYYLLCPGFLLFLHIKCLDLIGFVLEINYYLMLIWTIFSGTETELCGFYNEQSGLLNLNLLEVGKGIDTSLTIAFSEGFWPSSNVPKKMMTV